MRPDLGPLIADQNVAVGLKACNPAVPDSMRSSDGYVHYVNLLAINRVAAAKAGPRIRGALNDAWRRAPM